jgi:NADH dehydrogenase FAD-containing subunit
VRFLPARITQIGVSSKIITVDSGENVKFDKCLIATGSGRLATNLGRKLVDTDCAHNIYDVFDIQRNHQLVEAIRSGKHVTVIGADNWGSIFAVSKLASIAQQSGYVGSLSLVMPASGPLSSAVPRYLSQAIGKRLSSCGVELLTYSQVRYIGGRSTFAAPASMGADGGSGADDVVGVFVSKVFDTLNTSLLVTDKVAYAMTSSSTDPEIVYRGNPPPSVASHIASLPPTVLKIADAAGMEIAPGGAGIIVNRNMQALEGIYVAGELANVNFVGGLGRGQFSGVDHAHHSGVVAGRNMAGHFELYVHTYYSRRPPPPCSCNHRTCTMTVSCCSCSTPYSDVHAIKYSF